MNIRSLEAAKIRPEKIRKGKKAKLWAPAPRRSGGDCRGRASKELIFLIIRIHVLVIAFIMVLWSKSRLKIGSPIMAPPFAAESPAPRKAKALVVRPARQKPGSALKSPPPKPADPSKNPSKAAPYE